MGSDSIDREWGAPLVFSGRSWAFEKLTACDFFLLETALLEFFQVFVACLDDPVPRTEYFLRRLETFHGEYQGMEQIVSEAVGIVEMFLLPAGEQFEAAGRADHLVGLTGAGLRTPFTGYLDAGV